MALAGCQQIINYPSPRISTISPTSISAGQPTFTLTVTGFNFTPASTVDWNGSALSAIFVNTNTLKAQIPAVLIQNPGTSNITVTTPSPGGGTTQAITFVINPVTSPTPQINGTSPESVVAGSGGFTLTVNGANFVNQSVVNVGNVALQTAFISSSFLQVTRAGQQRDQRRNPAAHGRESGEPGARGWELERLLVPGKQPSAFRHFDQPDERNRRRNICHGRGNRNGIRAELCDPDQWLATYNHHVQRNRGVRNPERRGHGRRPESIAIQVMNPGPGGGTSNAATICRQSQHHRRSARACGLCL